MKQHLAFLFLLFVAKMVWSQHPLSGTVLDPAGQPIFAANVYCLQTPARGTVTDLDGRFQLSVDDLQDTLVLSFIGYQPKKLPLIEVSDLANLVVTLVHDQLKLSEITVKATNPISEQFAVTQLSRLDIYMNPVAQADPLKAITALPASTTANETANPSLRGSSADRTRVVLNGVPIYKPVRASQLNNQGFFSLFNPEIIDRQYVYASNPPLTHGNTSAGLVEINTTQVLEQNKLNLSATLASVGALVSQKIGGDAYVQAYANLQFSDAFVGIQPKALPRLNAFDTQDSGLNFHYKLSEKTRFNTFVYFINEHANVEVDIFGYSHDYASRNRRIFTVNTLTHLSKRGAFSLRNGTNHARTRVQYGNLLSRNDTEEIFTGLDYKHFLAGESTAQIGLSHQYRALTFRDSVPSYYYAWAPESPNFYSENRLQQHDLQAYAYLNWELTNDWSFSSGFRTNAPMLQQDYFWSAQLGLRYKPSEAHHVILSGGQYHNYNTPSFFVQQFQLLRSRQAALDYTYRKKQTTLQTAVYYKHETGDRMLFDQNRTDRINTFGVEFFWAQSLHKYVQFSIANSFVRQRQYIQGRAYRGERDFDYFVKTSLQYNHPRLFSSALTYISRPGSAYTPIINGRFRAAANAYEPIFSPELYSADFRAYHRLDLSLSRYIALSRAAIIPFFSITNVLNTLNESEVLYAADYGSSQFDYFQRRTVFFGVVWE